MKIGVLFSGFGGQYVGMGKDLYDGSRTMQEFFEEAANCLGINFVKLCFASSDAELSQIQNAYLSLFLVSSSLYALLQQEVNFTPDLLAGSGVGEYAALFAANSLTFPDGLYIINKYALAFEELLLQKHLGVMQITGMPISEIKRLSLGDTKNNQSASIACYIHDNQVHVSGTRDGLNVFVQYRQEQGAACKVEELDLGYGMHSPLMNDVVEKIKMYAEKVDFKDLSIPLINSVDGACIKNGESAKYSVMRQINEPIVWNQVMENFVGSDVVIVIGPGNQLAQITQQIYPDKKIFSVNTKDDIAQVKAYFEGEKSDGSSSE